MTTEDAKLVSIKILDTTRDYLKQAKKTLGVGSIDSAIQRIQEVANNGCYIDPSFPPYPPCDPLGEENEDAFNHRKCPSICPRYKNLKMTQWWTHVTSGYDGGGLTKEDYIKFWLEEHEEREQSSQEWHETSIKEAEEEHRNDPTYKAGNWLYDFEHRPFEPTPPLSREILEARFKDIVEGYKQAVLRMEKLRKQSLFDEWKRIWNYPACIEGIKDIEDPWADFPF